MSDITIEKLYENYDVLIDAKDKILEHTKEYEEILRGVKAGDKEKILATQFIAKFFKDFPSLQTQAIDALFDICENDNPDIRKQGIKALPILCMQNKNHTVQIADILSQLLQLVDPQENSIVTKSLVAVIKEDPLQAMKGVFKQMQSRDEETRDKCIKFLTTKIKGLWKDIKDVEDFIIAEVKSLLQESSGEEFQRLMQFLASTKMSNTVTGRKHLIEFAINQAELDTDLNLTDKETNCVDRLIICINLVLPYFSSQLSSSQFFIYLCKQVLPQMDAIEELERGDLLKMALYQQLADLSTNCGTLKDPVPYVEIIFEKLLAYMPLPPQDSEITEFPELNFSAVECLMYAFHRIARQCPEFLTDNSERLRDFRVRLQYFARGVQGCMRALREVDAAKDEKNKHMALKVLPNINSLIRDLFYATPNYKVNVLLSWKVAETQQTRPTDKLSSNSGDSSPTKRHIPITFDDGPDSKQSRKAGGNMQLYVPPSGKFSSNFPDRNDRRPLGRGRGRGQMRGRGRGFVRRF